MYLARLLGTILICTLVASVAWPLGGNLPHSRTMIGLVSLLLLALAALQQFRTKFPQRLTWAWLFLMLGLGYAMFQVMPASDALNQADIGLSSLGEQLSDEDPRAVVFRPSRFNRISYYPAATRASIAELSFSIAIFLATCCLVKSRSGVRAVFLALTITGVAVSFFAIVQRLLWNGKVFWHYEFTPGAYPFGPFINRNNGGSFILACLCGALFFAAYQYFKWKPQSGLESDLHYEWRENSRRGGSWYRKFIEFFATIQPRHLYCFSALIFMVVATTLTLSRGAMLGLLVMLIAAMFLLPIMNRVVVCILGLLMFLGGAMMVWLDQSDMVLARIQSLRNLQEAGGPRFRHWQDVWPYVSEHFWLGSGLGTYRYMQMPFQQDYFEATYAHAENVYLETVAELGVIGLVALVGFLATVSIMSWHLYRRPYAIDRAVGVAGLCCIVGQAVTSLFDFGVYQPANATVLAVLLGTVTARATCSPETANPGFSSLKQDSRSWFAATSRLLALVGCGALCLLGIRESHGVESLKQAKSDLKAYNLSLGEAEPKLDDALLSLQIARNLRPDDAEVDFQFGEYELAVFRRENTKLMIQIASELAAETAADSAPSNPDDSMAAPQNEEVDGPAEDATDETTYSREAIWINNSVTSLHRIYRFAQRNNPELVAEIDSNPNMKFLESAWEYFVASNEKCEFPPKTEFRLAQLSAFFDQGNEATHLQLALDRSSPNAELLFEAGLLALHSGDQATAVRLWRDCLIHTKRFEREIVESSMFELPMKVLFLDVLPQEPEYLLRISKIYLGQGKRTLPNMYLLEHTKNLLMTADLTEHRRLVLQGEIEQQLENFQSAARYFRFALALDEEDVQSRVKLAICLQRLDQPEEAMKHLKKSELTPGTHLPTVKRMLKQIRNQPLKPIIN